MFSPFGSPFAVISLWAMALLASMTGMTGS